MGKKRIMKKYEYQPDGGESVFAEVVYLGDSKYADGIMYTFRCIDAGGNTLFAIENGHEQPHMHLKGRKIQVDYDWETAQTVFRGMIREYAQKIKEGR